MAPNESNPQAPAVPATSQQPVDDPFDAGNTDLYPRPDSAAPASAAPTPPTPLPSAGLPPRDPVTGQWLKPEHPVYLLEQARELGFGDDEINEMSSNALGRAIQRTYKQQLDFRTQQSTARTLDETAQRAPAAPPAAPAGPDGPDWGTDDEGNALSEKDYAGPIARAIKLAYEQSKRLQALEEELAGLRQTEQQRRMSERDREIDGVFVGLGKDYAGSLGEGSIYDLAKDADERERRNAVVLMAERMQQGTLKQRIAAAAAKLFGKPAAPAPTPTPTAAAAAPTNGSRITPEQWNEAALQRPTSRKVGELPPGEDKARQNLSARLGQPHDSAEESEVADGLLD